MASDPSQLELHPNPLAEVTDQELWDFQLALALACGRSHAALNSTKRRQHFCHLFRVLKIEADFRGVVQPAPPYHPSDLSLIA